LSSGISQFLVPLLLLWLAVVAGTICWYWREFGRLWREPVLACPVLVLESDDWGAGPLSQAAALEDISGVLRRYADAAGRRPVVSLAVVLAVPDGKAIASDGTSYQRVCLDEAPLVAVLKALKQGEAERTFSLQLHGLEHFWPDALMASSDPQVHAWLREPMPASTERLPSHLQSRWTDASSLPSQPLSDEEVHRAVKEEVDLYVRVIGRAPDVVVPPTFVWTPAVERAWAANGVDCVITPGCRYTSRAADGASVDDGAVFVNGDNTSGVMYLVRYDYFEPARGRDAAHALRALQSATAEGRPCVLENHRVNFCGDAAMHAHSLRELEKLVSGALQLMPHVRFLSSADLYRALKSRDRHWLRQGFLEKFPFQWQRFRNSGRLWKLLRLSGATLPGEWLARAISRGAAHSRA
jgi:hypothetical protein